MIVEPNLVFQFLIGYPPFWKPLLPLSPEGKCNSTPPIGSNWFSFLNCIRERKLRFQFWNGNPMKHFGRLPNRADGWVDSDQKCPWISFIFGCVNPVCFGPTLYTFEKYQPLFYWFKNCVLSFGWGRTIFENVLLSWVFNICFKSWTFFGGLSRFFFISPKTSYQRWIAVVLENLRSRTDTKNSSKNI